MPMWALARPSGGGKLDKSRFWYTGKGWSREHSKRRPFATKRRVETARDQLQRTDVTIVRVA